MIPRSLTSRLIFLYCVILLLLGSAFLGFTVLSFRHYSREVITNLLEVRTQDIWRLSRNILDQPDQIAAVIAHHFSPESQNRFIRLRVNGRILYRSGEPLSGVFSAKDVPPNLPVNTRALLQDNVVVYSRRFTAPSGQTVIVDTGQFQISGTIQDRLTKSLFVGLPLMLLMAGIAGWLVMRRALRPIEVMISAAENYTFNQSHKRLPTMGTEPRIEALGLALNRMLDRLDSAYSHVSRFTSDAAHELRTPLTIIRGELDLVAQKRNLPPDVDEALKTVLEEMTRLSGLVDSLITLSRMDSLWGKTAHDTVDLLELSLETIDQMHLLLEEKHISVTKPEGPAVLVSGDRGRLKQVVVNLLDNAIKYTAPGGNVTIQTYAEGVMGVITVEDTGIGIDPQNHRRVFDRFYRVAPDRGAFGAGLGLAIVKSICQAHGGTVNVRSVPGLGSCFAVEIPLSTASSHNPGKTGSRQVRERATAPERVV